MSHLILEFGCLGVCGLRYVPTANWEYNTPGLTGCSEARNFGKKMEGPVTPGKYVADHDRRSAIGQAVEMGRSIVGGVGTTKVRGPAD